ncbi:MraY family glycosyltransferase [Pseudohalioglobus lutimaris]|uniref:MraY family glycosyltransferase n=1 Tax=Pseudohalioglobus lutimaris TaxID=1737061 RepID=UPI0013FD930D|nr:MraY family glycosyltransferase [Pseudohalioglobus lutimaris]
MDDPTGNARKIHAETMPRSGGIAIVAATSIALLVALPFNSQVVSYVLASLIIVVFGLLDDMLELSPKQKIGGQALGVMVAMAGGMVLTDFPLFSDAPAWIAYSITFIFVLGVINGVNFSDGMDGLAAGTTLIALGLIFVLAQEASAPIIIGITLAVGAALLGFLRFNTHPARIFMGDSGSQFLGFTLAWLAITLTQSESSSVSTLLPLLILGIPVMDIFQVVPVRIHKKLPLPGPDREHFHHQVAKLGFYNHEVVAIVYILQSLLLISAYLLRANDDWYVLVFYCSFLVIVLGALVTANIVGWRFHDEAITYEKRRNRFFRKLGEYHSYTGLFFSSAISLVLIGSALFATQISDRLLGAACICAGFLWLFKLTHWQTTSLVFARAASYPACVLLIYSATVSIQGEKFNWLIDFLFAVFVLLLLVSIRITRKQYFGLTNQDLLVALFLVCVAPLLLIEYGQGLEVVRLLFRTSVMLYAAEYALARGDSPMKRLTLGSLIALSVLAVHF